MKPLTPIRVSTMPLDVMPALPVAPPRAEPASPALAPADDGFARLLVDDEGPARPDPPRKPAGQRNAAAKPETASARPAVEKRAQKDAPEPVDAAHSKGVETAATDFPEDAAPLHEAEGEEHAASDDGLAEQTTAAAQPDPAPVTTPAPVLTLATAAAPLVVGPAQEPAESPATAAPAAKGADAPPPSPGQPATPAVELPAQASATAAPRAKVPAHAAAALTAEIQAAIPATQPASAPPVESPAPPPAVQAETSVVGKAVQAADVSPAEAPPSKPDAPDAPAAPAAKPAPSHTGLQRAAESLPPAPAPASAEPPPPSAPVDVAAAPDVAAAVMAEAGANAAAGPQPDNAKTDRPTTRGALKSATTPPVGAASVRSDIAVSVQALASEPPVAEVATPVLAVEAEPQPGTGAETSTQPQAEAAPENAAPQPFTAQTAGAALQTAAGPRATTSTVGTLATQIVRKLEARTSRFDIELDPVGLGRVNVTVEINPRGQITAALAFERPQSAAELGARSGELRAALEKAGFDVASGGLSFQSGNGGAAGQDARDNAAWTANAGGRAFDTASRAADQADIPPVWTGARTAAGGLDIRI